MMQTEENTKSSVSAKAGTGKTVHNVYRIIALAAAFVLLAVGFTALAGGTVLAESAGTPDAIPAGYNNVVNAQNQLLEFFCDWAQGDMDSLVAETTVAWRLATEDHAAALEKILSGGVPLSFQIDSIYRADNSPDRIADCVVKMDPLDGSEPRYERIQIRLKNEEDNFRYAVDPESLASREPAQPLPDKEIVPLTEKAITNFYLDTYFPGVRENLIPVNLSQEDQGIRMTVISALVKEQEAWIVYSLEDLEGRWSCCDFYYPSLNTRDIGNDNSFSPFLLYSNARQHKAVHMENVRFDSPVDTSDRTVHLRLYGLREYKSKFMDFAPLIAQYAVTAEGVDRPTHNGYVNPQEDVLKVLDWSNSLDIPVTEDGFLSAIGWIDGKLHIQFRTTNTFSFHNTTFTEYNGGKAETKYWNDGNPRVYWRDGSTQFIEHVINYQPADPESTHLEGALDYMEELLPRLDLTVEVPLSSILEKNAQETADVPESADVPETAEAPAELPNDVSDSLQKNYSEVMDKLRPVNVSSEKRGVRLTVESGLVRENESWFVFTLQDTEGGLFSLDNTVAFDTETNLGQSRLAQSTLLAADYENRKLTYMSHMKYRYVEVPATALYSFSLKNLAIDGDPFPAEWQIQFLYTLVRDNSEASETGASAVSGTLRSAINRQYPGIAEELKPVNLVCENDGIRAQIISALVKDNQSWILYSLQDLNGGRFEYINNDSAQITVPYGRVKSYTTRELERDEENRKAVFLRYCTYRDTPSGDKPEQTVSIDYIRVTDHWYVQLEPYLKEYMDTAKGIAPPEDCLYDYGAKPDSGGQEVRVLDYNHPLDVPINEEGNLLLTGIGWIDGQLQVQIHNTADHKKQYMGLKYFYPVWNVHVAGYSQRAGKYMHTDLSPVVWNDPEKSWNTWKNFIFDLSPDEIDTMDLYVEIDHYLDLLTGGWRFNIPFDNICAD